MNVTADVRDVLEECSVDGNVLKLPQRQLTNYRDVNKVLEAMGGKWTRKLSGHLFEFDPSDLLDSVLATGVVTSEKSQFQMFFTPRELAEQMVDRAGILQGDTVLEPSAGRGAIASVIRERLSDQSSLVLVELNERNAAILREDGYPNVHQVDFLDWAKAAPKFSKIVANPPFTRKQDIDHVDAMIDCLAPGGVLVSVMSAGVLSNTDRKTAAFRERVGDLDSTIEPLPDSSFKASGTMVSTVLLTLSLPFQ